MIVHTRDGTSKVRRRVYCVERDAAVSIGECAACERCTSFPPSPNAPGAGVTCLVTHDRILRSRATPDLAEAAARASVGEVMGSLAVGVERDVPVKMLRKILEASHASALAVVTGDGLLVGVVAAADLLSADLDATAEHVMTTAVHSISATARVAHALALMAREGVRQVPVLADDGEVVGIMTGGDALTWVARGLGYEQEHPPAPPYDPEAPGHERVPLADLEDKLRAEASILRGLAGLVDEAAAHVLSGDASTLRALAGAVKHLATCVRVHFAIEEMQLAPLLAEASPSSMTTMQRLRRAHSSQRSALAALADEIAAGVRPKDDLAREATLLASALRASLDEEDRAILSGSQGDAPQG